MCRVVFADFCEGFHVFFCRQCIDEIACPPIVVVPCGNQILVVLHEFSVADDNLAVVPNGTYVVANFEEFFTLVNT